MQVNQFHMTAAMRACSKSGTLSGLVYTWFSFGVSLAWQRNGEKVRFVGDPEWA